MSKVTVTAKTIEQAVKSALSQLQTSEDLVNIRVIEEPSKGFFGFGSKQAVVEVEVKEVVQESQSQAAAAVEQEESLLDKDWLEEAKHFLETILSQMGLSVRVTVEPREEHTIFNVQGEGIGLMIGRRGQTLDSIQYLTNLVANRYSKDYVRIVIDPENYRARRQETLEQLADRVAKKVVRSGEKMVLEPMNPAERKIIHTHLQEYAGISTKSQGEGNNRRIVVFPRQSKHLE
ncbi:RNA-binding cell elongation regulator Jag/EloR [Caldalkalibacillus mannanilyticus]|uniref:RNA-binding cell elongation regulator Jag/EloR n=1 Tax=Caldalkalibacillus mannanilyticus TaxID=1418 RepID=UPI00046A4B12|nr:RNA-binding cell elongation regulator Jag/EloR [Caldalkalibacillus mannanilyticus]